MYTEINEKLELARQGIARLHKIYSMISQLEAELGPLEQKECELKKALEKENLDVEKLENRSFSSVLFSILGSLDKHIQKENAEAFAAKLKYDQAELRVGELWLNLPMTAIDTSRQLLTTYQGVNLKFPIQEKLKVELGHVSKNSPRNEEDFYKFSYTQKGIKHYSDGLDYLNLSYDVNKDFNINYYYL